MTTLSVRVIRNAPALAAILVLGAGIADAQAISGKVVARGDGTPVSAAMVTLIDSSGRAVATKLAEDSGTFFFVAPLAGRYSIRVERIGFRSVASSAFLVTEDATVRVPITTDRESVSLRAIVVNANRRCLVRPQEGLATARLE